MSDLTIGFILVFIGSVLQGSWAVPMGFTKKWQWENMWFIYSLLSMIILNLLIARMFVPDLFSIYAQSPAQVWGIIGLGVLWGSGVVLFGLGIAGAGLALSYALMFGALLAAGAIIPLLILSPGDIVTKPGLVAMLGVVISLIGIAYSGKAGIMKERDQHGSQSGEVTQKKMSMRTGIIICITGGILISVVNIAFAVFGPWASQVLGENARYTGNLVWGILFSTGGVINSMYCVYLMGKNKNASNITTSGTGRNWWLVFVMAFIWIISFSFYGQGAIKMGQWGPVIGWSMFNIVPIATANVWAIVLGEWRGASAPTKKTMGIALFLFLVAIIIFTYGASL